MEPILRVFIAEHCSTCEDACAIATRVALDYPGITVEVVDIGDPQATVPATVFAIPTFMLNNRIVSLGTPYLDDIIELVEDVLSLQTY